MSYLPTIKVGLLDGITWSNGSRVKPLNPITTEIIAQFEDKKDHKVNWINDEIGLIVLAGDYNYLVYKDTEFYTLTKTRVYDADKLIFVYTVTKDHWQNFISNPNNSIEGCLVKTNNETVLWDNIQYTKAAVLNANYEQIFLTYKGQTEEKNTGLLCDFLEVVPFEKEKGEITKFSVKRFVKSDFEAFKQKLLNVDYTNIKKTPNQIISYCPLRNVKGWQNYIAQLVETFLTESNVDNPIKLGKIENLSKAAGLSTSLKKINDSTLIYTISKDKPHETITKEEQKIIKKIDLSKIDDIELIDPQTTKKKGLFNKEITGFFEDSRYKGIEKNNKTWILKNKMFSPVADPSHYSYLNVHSRAFNENYTILNKRLEDINLKSLEPFYKEHKYDFSENNVPALFYADWSETLTNSTLKNIIYDNDYSTEMGFLLYKISNFKKICYNNITNKFVYNGKPLYLTTGIKTPPEYLTCLTVRKLSDNTVVREEKRALFGDIYRNEVNKSVWLTIWTAYLWKGDLDRIFEGLSPDNLQNQFSYTVTQCYIDDKGEVFDTTKQAAQEEDKREKLPTWGISPFKPLENHEEFKRALKELTERRKQIEINDQIFPPSLDQGDIVWNEAQQGFFSDTEEIKFDDPVLVLFGDSSYSYRSLNRTVRSLKTSDYGYKFGLLEMWQVPEVPNNPNNLISQVKKLPRIGRIDTLLTVYPQDGQYDEVRYIQDWRRFLDNKNHWLNDNVYFYKGNNWFSKDNFHNQWPKKDGKIRFVTYTTLWTSGTLFASSYVTLFFEGTTEEAYIYTDKVGTYWAGERVQNYINNYLLKKYYLIDSSTYSLTSWERPGIAGQDMNNSTWINKLINEIFQKLNQKEPTQNNRVTYIDETELKKHTSSPLYFAFKSNNKPVFYVSITWNTERNEPVITIYLADWSLLVTEPLKQLPLVDSSSLVNTNITQVINQRNFLYVHGENIELQTKIITNSPHKNFKLRIQNIEIGDTTASHYRALFESETENIKKYISVPTIKIIEGAGLMSEHDRLQYKIQHDYRLKTEELERELNKENERLANQNLRNQSEDLQWEKNNFFLQSTLNTVGSLGGAAASFFTSGMSPMTALNAGTSIAGSIMNIWNQSHQLDVKSRNLQQADIESAFKISYAKNTMDERHKNDEMREKLQLYKLTNTQTSKLPNQADVLQSIEKFDGVLNGVCIYNRIPEGKLLEHLTQYHQNYGYDITVNDFKLNVQSIIKDKEKTLYQFVRIDKLSISNIADYEQIKACFLNGIYLTQFEYKLIHLSYLELQKKHKDLLAAARARVLAAEKAERQRQLEEIREASKGEALAKKDFAEVLKQRDSCRNHIDETNKKLKVAEDEIKKLKNNILSYQANDRTIKAGYEIKIKELENNEEHKQCLDDLEIKKQEIETYKREIEEKKAEIEQLNKASTESAEWFAGEIKTWSVKEVQLERQIEELTKEKKLLFDGAKAATDLLGPQVARVQQLRGEKEELEKQLTAERKACEDHEKKIRAASTNYLNCQKEKTALQTQLDAKIKELDVCKLKETTAEKALTHEDHVWKFKDTVAEKAQALIPFHKAFKDAWYEIARIIHLNSSDYNYIAFKNTTYWISAYNIHFHWGGFNINKKGGGEQVAFSWTVPYNYTHLNDREPSIPAYTDRENKIVYNRFNDYPPILPKNWSVVNKDYSSSYKGFVIRNVAKNTEIIGFYLSTSDSNFNSLLSQLRNQASIMQTNSNNWRKGTKALAKYIRDNKALFIVPEDCEKYALTWTSRYDY